MISNANQLDIDGISYEVRRITDDAGIGYIEVRDPADGNPLGRIFYHGPAVPMEVTTLSNGLPRPVIEWMLECADHALA